MDTNHIDHRSRHYLCDTMTAASHTGELVRNERRTINAWAMYDWANSAYALVITSAIFPAYYNSITRVNGSSKLDLEIGRAHV